MNLKNIKFKNNKFELNNLISKCLFNCECNLLFTLIKDPKENHINFVKLELIHSCITTNYQIILWKLSIRNPKINTISILNKAYTKFSKINNLKNLFSEINLFEDTNNVYGYDTLYNWGDGYYDHFKPKIIPITEFPKINNYYYFVTNSNGRNSTMYEYDNNYYGKVIEILHNDDIVILENIRCKFIIKSYMLYNVV